MEEELEILEKIKELNDQLTPEMLKNASKEERLKYLSLLENLEELIDENEE